MGSKLVTESNVVRVSADQSERMNDHLAVEEPLEIQLSYGSPGHPIRKSVSVTMRTPGHDEELAVGFLFTEGILQSAEQVTEVKMPQKNTVLVTLAENVQPSLQKTERNFYTTSSCGVCGKSSIDSIRTVSVHVPGKDDLQVAATLLYSLPHNLRERQAAFESTGGLHASALFDLLGNLKIIREDVGRHNALDKVIGAAFMNQELPLSRTMLLLSGRASFELIQKASMAGIKIVAAIGAPSSLAVELAKEFGMTLVGFLKREGFNIYSGEQRVGGRGKAESRKQ